MRHRPATQPRRPAAIQPGDRIPALSSDGAPFVVDTVDRIDAPHPHTRQAPHWRITSTDGRAHYYDASHMSYVLPARPQEART